MHKERTCLLLLLCVGGCLDSRADAAEPVDSSLVVDSLAAPEAVAQAADIDYHVVRPMHTIWGAVDHSNDFSNSPPAGVSVAVPPADIRAAFGLEQVMRAFPCAPCVLPFGYVWQHPLSQPVTSFFIHFAAFVGSECLFAADQDPAVKAIEFAFSEGKALLRERGTAVGTAILGKAWPWQRRGRTPALSPRAQSNHAIHRVHMAKAARLPAGKSAIDCAL